MAVHAPITGAPTRAILLPPALAFIMGLPIAPRAAVERTIQAAIDALDLLDGDPDAEPIDEREPDGTDHGDPAWIEWQTRGRHKADAWGAESLARDPIGNIIREDDEDDDPAEDDDHDTEHDGREEEEPERLLVSAVTPYSPANDA